MSNNKDFSILKWFIFPPIVAGLSAGIAFFNIDVFGLGGSVLYLVALGAVNLASLVMLKCSASTKPGVRKAAYTFEGLMLLALLGNISYSLSAQRDLSLVKQGETNHNAAIGEISKLRGGRTQREALKTLSASTDVRTAFGQYDKFLFSVMVAELAFSLGGLFCVYVLATNRGGGRKVLRGAFKGARPAEAVDAFRGIVAAERGAQIGFAPLKAPEGALKQTEGALKQSEASSETFDKWSGQYPPGAWAGDLRVIGQDSGVRIYGRNDYLGHVAWARYLANVSDPQRPTETEIRALLRDRAGDP